MTGEIVEVWLIRTDLPDRVLADLEILLDDSERKRADSVPLARHRRRFIAAHGAVRVIVGHYLGAPPAQLSWRRGLRGKPELAGTWTGGAQLSVSRSGALAALALTSRRRVGVDVQELPAGLNVSRMCARFYPPAEARFVMAASAPAGQLSRFTRLWTRKEACVKVTGGRLIPGLQLPVRGAGVLVVGDPGGPLPGEFLVRDVPVPPGFHAAVAMEGTLPYRVTRRWWPGDWPTTGRRWPSCWSWIAGPAADLGTDLGTEMAQPSANRRGNSGRDDLPGR